MKIDEAKDFIKFLTDHIQEIESSPHDIEKEVCFFLDDQELDLDIDRSKENVSYAFDVHSMGGCGCWYGVDIKLKKKSK